MLLSPLADPERAVLPSGETLAPGDLISFAYPCDEDPWKEAPRRVCLVLAVEAGPAGPRIVVAYGTSRDSKSNTGLELRLRRPAVLARLALRRPTRFVCARHMRVRPTDPRLRPPCSRERLAFARLEGEERARLMHLRAILQSGEYEPRRRRRRSGPGTPSPASIAADRAVTGSMRASESDRLR
jgi:hypothetical protein